MKSYFLFVFFGFVFVFLGADVCKEEAPVGVFRYPSYVQDIMGYG